MKEDYDTPGETPEALTPTPSGDKEDADIYSDLQEMESYYEDHPPPKARMGSEWQIYARLLLCHWITAFIMLAILVAIKGTGVLPGSE